MTSPTHDLAKAAAALLDWAREHTSPRQENSPHDLLVTLQAALFAMGATMAPDGRTMID